MRTIYRTVVTNAAGAIVWPQANDFLPFDGFFPSPQNTAVRLVLPTTANPATPPSCQLGQIGFADVTVPDAGTPFVTSHSSSGSRRLFFPIPSMFAAAEHPHEHMWPWICVCITENCATTGGWIPTNMRIAVVRGCNGDTTHDFGTDADLCVNMISETARLNPRLDWGEGFNVAGNALWIERRQRTRCCGYRTSAVNDARPRYGMCINPNLQKCCTRNSAVANGTEAFVSDGGLGKPFVPFREKCCYGGIAPDGGNREVADPTIISYLDDWCPCTQERLDEFCNRQLPQVDTNFCCTQTKYAELTAGIERVIWGKCYDGKTTQCCDTGDIYDPGAQQCCTINGVQTLNIPCPCGVDSHCGANQACCGDPIRPTFPTPIEPVGICDPYITFPDGTAPYSRLPCLGHCIDTRFQICCNGRTCIDSFEVCCNNTCCNKFNERCTMGWKSGALGQRSNPLYFRVPFEICTTVEALDPFRGILVFFFPLILLMATVLGLATTLFFAKRQNTLQPLSAYEKSMFVLATLAIFMSWPLYFSPLWKYAIITIWFCFFTMAAALSQIRLLNIAAIILLGTLLIYLIDPWYGNEILTLAYDRAAPERDAVHGYTGVLASLASQYISTSRPNGFCTSWYSYFERDTLTEDRVRRDNPSKYTFGFCQRDWFTALGIFEVIAVMIVFLLFFVTLITHLRNILFTKAEKTEEVVGWY